MASEEKARLRLWVVRDAATGAELRNDRGEVVYFSSKRRAKTARNHAAAASCRPHRVGVGPDHRRRKVP